MIGKALYSLLNGTTNAAAQVYADVILQEVTGDSIRYAVLLTQVDRTLTSSENVYEALVQVDCFSSTYSAAQSLADEVRVILEGASGTIGTVVVDKILIDDAGTTLFDDEAEEFRVMMKFKAFYYP